MMKIFLKYLFAALVSVFFAAVVPLFGQTGPIDETVSGQRSAVANESEEVAASEGTEETGNINVSEIISGYISDSYGWHITKVGDRDITIPLPVLVRSKKSGWHCFSSGKIADGKTYKGFYKASGTGGNAGKIVEMIDGREVRPLDLSITMNVLTVFMNAVLLLVIVLCTADWYRKHNILKESPSGIAAFMEPVIMMVHNMARDNIGEKDYRKFSPYLCMAFTFILLSNLVGIIPFFPGGANATGNIAVTMALAMFTFVVVNAYGSKEYYKEMFWPDVPGFLKPIMPLIEVFGAIMKPVSLTIRLFANMLAGHIQIISIVCVIFIVAKYGAVLLGSMGVVTVLFGAFLDLLEILISFIQAYVFTILSSIYIGMARAEN